MTDNTNNTISSNAKADKAEETATAPVKAAATAARKASKPARKARTTNSKRSAPKASAKRSAPKASAKRTANARRATTRAVNSTRRAAKATIAAAAPQIERNTAMAYDFTKMFAGFELPPPTVFRLSLPVRRAWPEWFAVAEDAEQMNETAKANLEALTRPPDRCYWHPHAGSQVLATSRDGMEQASARSRPWPMPSRRPNSSRFQSELARASFDRMVAEGSKLTEDGQAGGEAAQPLSNRATINAERINDLLPNIPPPVGSIMRRPFVGRPHFFICSGDAEGCGAFVPAIS